MPYILFCVTPHDVTLGPYAGKQSYIDVTQAWNCKTGCSYGFGGNFLRAIACLAKALRMDGPTDQPTNGPMDQPTNPLTNKAAYRVACMPLKKTKQKRSNTRMDLIPSSLKCNCAMQHEWT